LRWSKKLADADFIWELVRKPVDWLKRLFYQGDANSDKGASGTTADLTASDLDDFSDELIARLDASGKLQRVESEGIERKFIIELSRRLKPSEPLDFDRAVAELENALAIAVDVIAKGRRGTNRDDFVNAVLARVAEQTKAGLFNQAAKEIDAAIAELDHRETVGREEVRLSQVALLEVGVEQDILRRDANSAAHRILEIASIEHEGDTTAIFTQLRERHSAYHIEGRDKGINFSLEIAIELSRLAIASANDKERRAVALDDLGRTLRRLGERESASARLEEAIKTFRRALQEDIREQTPLLWAAIQNNLGSALRALGARESGTARLDEAVVACREALKERTREQAPLEWAATQNNLGNALRIIGERESSTARLDEAIVAYREALKERTRERAPLEWAATQNNLGNALRIIGERESSTARLDEAIVAYREALKERTRERVPLDWAATQNSLANALTDLSEYEVGTVRLDQAVAAYREALKERLRERVPLDWAATQNNLGNALQILSHRERTPERLDEAITAYRAALKEYRRVPFARAITQSNLGNALAELGQAKGGSAYLKDAAAAYRAALDEWSLERAPLQRVQTQISLGDVLSKLGETDVETESLQEAIAIYSASIREAGKLQIPQLDNARAGLTRARSILAERRART
jgi:tetratricopeptide (TPR) repeat protein